MRSIWQKSKSIEAPSERQEKADKNMDKAFALPDEAASLRVFRRSDRGQLKILDVLSLSGVPNADELISVLQDRWGGGRYYILPTINGRKAGDGFAMEFDNPAKETPRKKATTDAEGRRGSATRQRDSELEQVKEQLRQLEEKEREDRLFERLRAEIRQATPKSNPAAQVMESLLSNFPQVVTGLAGIVGNRESAADMLEKISAIWKNIEGSMPKPVEPVEQAKALADLIFNVAGRAQMPPVTASGSAGGSFLANFLNELARKLGWLGAAQAGPLGMPQLGQGIGAQAPGFAGIPTTAGATASRPGGQAAANLTLEALGCQPIQKLRSMIAEREDPERVAAIAVHFLDFLFGFSDQASPIMNYIRSFLWNPAAAFDQISEHVPELRADQEYTAKLKEAIVKEVNAYVLEVQRSEAEPAEAAQDEQIPGEQDQPAHPGQDEKQQAEAAAVVEANSVSASAAQEGGSQNDASIEE